MKALVLAAGLGKRLQPLTNHLPKCLLKVGGRPLVDHHFDAFGECGVDEAVYVVGHEAHMIKQKLRNSYRGVKVRYILNPKYRVSGSAYSVFLAKNEFTREPFIIFDGDVLFPPELLNVLIEAEHDNVMLIENDSKKFSEEPVLVMAEKGIVVEATKNAVDKTRLVGECIGMFKFGSEAPEALVKGLRETITAYGIASQYDDAYNAVYSILKVHSVLTEGLPWAEIDHPKDLENAIRETFPQIMYLRRKKTNKAVAGVNR